MPLTGLRNVLVMENEYAPWSWLRWLNLYVQANFEPVNASSSETSATGGPVIPALGAQADSGVGVAERLRSNSASLDAGMAKLRF
jgi:hypothetical protein